MCSVSDTSRTHGASKRSCFRIVGIIVGPRRVGDRLESRVDANGDGAFVYGLFYTCGVSVSVTVHLSDSPSPFAIVKSQATNSLPTWHSLDLWPL